MHDSFRVRAIKLRSPKFLVSDATTRFGFGSSFVNFSIVFSEVSSFGRSERDISVSGGTASGETLCCGRATTTH
jgi:hypothetical protein